MSERHFLIPCKIERGAFERERVFKIMLSDQTRYKAKKDGMLVGTSDVSHLRDESKAALQIDAPPYGSEIDGFVQCRKIRDLPENWLLVEVPSADLIHVAADELVPA